MRRMESAGCSVPCARTRTTAPPTRPWPTITSGPASRNEPPRIDGWRRQTPRVPREMRGGHAADSKIERQFTQGCLRSLPLDAELQVGAPTAGDIDLQGSLLRPGVT